MGGCLTRWVRVAVAGLALMPAAHAQSLGDEPRYAAIVIDATNGQVLYERRADLERHPASITKVMTLYLAFDEIAAGRLKLTDRVEITPWAARQPASKLGLRAGESLSVDEAVRIIAVKSANDIAVALAERIAGSERAFVERMNRRALGLGMAHTHFANASGLPSPTHWTTARDLATLSRALLTLHGDRYAYFAQASVDYGGRPMANHNRLLGRVPGVDGIKTGYTVASGFTLAASAAREGRRLIAIVLGSTTRPGRDANVTALLDAGFTVLRDRSRGVRATVAGLLGERDEIAPVAPPGDAIGALIEQGSAGGGQP